MAETAMQRLSLTDSQGTRDPNKNDVLCGRGGSINSHPGNENFRELVEKHRRVYLNARFKQEKRLIATSIVSDIRALDPPGRFLAKDPVSGSWCDIGDEKARDKTSQALRENAPSIRAGINGGEKKPRPKSKRKSKAAPKSRTPSPAHPSAYPMQPFYNGYYGQPGQMPPPPHPPQPVGSQQGQPVNPYPGHPVCAYPGQPVGTHPGQPVIPQPGQPVVSQPGQPLPGHYPPPHPSQYQYPNGPAGSNVAWPTSSVPSSPASSRIASPQTLQSNDGSAGASAHNGSIHSPVPDEVPSVKNTPQHEEKPRAPPALQTHEAPYIEQRQNEGQCLQYSPIETNVNNAKKARPNGQNSYARKSPDQPQESRNEESQVMDIEGDGTQGSSLLSMVANHILGAWDTDAICGVDADFVSPKPKNNDQQNGFHQSSGIDESMPPPKERKRNSGAGDLLTRWSFSNTDAMHNGPLLSPGVSFESQQGISPAVSMDVDGTAQLYPKDWRAGEIDANSLGSMSSGLISMNENVLNQVPSWEGSFHSMSTASIKQKDSMSAAAPNYKRDESRTGSEISYDTFRSQDYVDTRMAIALQQQENVAAFEEFKKRHESTVKRRTNQTARSSALDHLKIAREKEHEHQQHHALSEHANDSFFSGVGDYMPPDDQPLAQEEADHKLALELQRFEQARAGTVQQMERIRREGERDAEKPSTQRTGRSVFWSSRA